MPINYDKWNNIAVSDDEDDTHPNVDTPSLFRWRHKARVEKEEELRQERIAVDKEGDKLKAKLAKSKVSDEEKKKQLEHWKKKEAEIADKERKAPQSVDTLSKEKESKTIINKPVKYEDLNSMSDEARAESYKKFMEENEELVKQFGFTRGAAESEKFLDKNRQLVCEHTSNHLVVWCIDLEMEEKHELMKSIARQTISMQFILELAKGVKRHPAECYPLFYKRYKDAYALIEENKLKGSKEEEYHKAFEAELQAFIERVEKRAKQKIDEAMAEYEKEQQEEKEERIKVSPGGLDPQEVMENLPEELQECFVQRDISMMNDLMAKDLKKYLPHIQRCVLSGLWVPSKDSPLYRLIATEEEMIEIEKQDEERARLAAENGESEVTEEEGHCVIREAKNSDHEEEENSTPKIEKLNVEEEISKKKEEEVVVKASPTKNFEDEVD